jgi:hypothetical protein
MKKLLFILLFITSVFSALAQTGWPPIGAKWHYSYQPCDIVGPCSSKEFIYFEAVKDTMVNDTVCTKIIVEYHNDKEEVKYLGNEFIYSTENQVYNYHHGHFYLLYDFSLQVGDTVALSLGSNCNLYNQLESTDVHFWDSAPIKHFVTERDSIEIDGKKYLSMDMGFTFESNSITPILMFDYRIIIKNIGSLEFLTGNLVTGIESGFYGPLRCYSDSSVTYTTDIPCDMLTSSTEGIKKNTKVWVYPNPVTVESVIHFPNPGEKEVTIEITNSAGKTIETTETCENYSVINAEKYFFRFRITSL